MNWNVLQPVMIHRNNTFDNNVEYTIAWCVFTEVNVVCVSLQNAAALEYLFASAYSSVCLSRRQNTGGPT